jgi:NAD(P)-dependent dehydrogenase (short-subunit alcohol dehydrogenase family)
MDLRLIGRIAIVTGSSRGLGLASAAALVAEGCFVTICARDVAGLTEAASRLRSLAPPGTLGGADPVLAVAADVSSAEGIERVVSRTADAFGGLDILVNNVGLPAAPRSWIRLTRSGVRRSTRPCSLQFAPPVLPCLTCAGGVAAPS